MQSNRLLSAKSLKDGLAAEKIYSAAGPERLAFRPLQLWKKLRVKGFGVKEIKAARACQARPYVVGTKPAQLQIPRLGTPIAGEGSSPLREENGRCGVGAGGGRPYSGFVMVRV